MNTAVRIAAQVLLFVLAVVVFVLGLGVGLKLNLTIDTALWIVLSGAIVILNIVWIVKAAK